MRRVLFLLLSALSALLLLVSPATAAEVDEVAAEAAATGFYLERGADISESQAGELVGQMRNAGEGFVLVVLSDEPAAGAATFADNVQFAIGRGLVLVLSPESLGLAGDGDVYDELELAAALDAAFDDGGDDFDVAAAFVESLTGVPVSGGGQPVPVPTSAAVPAPQTQTPTSSSGGGGSGFVWFIIIVGGLGLLVWWMMRRAKKRAAATEVSQNDEKLNQARYLIQEQLNDVANDILALEDEVRVADNDRASDFYESASETYNEATEALPKANSAQALLNLSNQLDVAIWQLDSAEAILDDKPLPRRPEPKRLEPERVTVDRRPSSTVPGPSSYQRRSTRRSSFGGGGLLDLLIAVGGGMMANRSRSSSRTSSRGGGGLGGGLGDLFGRRSRPAPPPPQPTQRYPTPPPPSSGGTSNPVPGPGRPATPSSSSRSTMPKSTRRGTSGRVRMGRKRRRK